MDKDTTRTRIYIPYFAYGLSIRGTSKKFLYELDIDRILLTE